MDDYLKDKLQSIELGLQTVTTKVDDMNSRLHRIETDQAAIKVDVKYHIRRTDILENDLKPIHDRYTELMGFIKFIGATIALVGAIETTVHVILPWLQHL